MPVCIPSPAVSWVKQHSPVFCRNRRMFGALLGTLKRFKNDEAKQKDKVMYRFPLFYVWVMFLKTR
ncbi:hypothetical protein E2C01_052278 [Portunus trituberculatus]|uniref:Pinin/SDK/MemA protein domain-containing protein n=1 Tax=Portunus trituberculatus TaxID=210409 RepID=A0A5B7GH50_PORTR|nr:hypothetical protein [Portunus trituberculatus]